MGLLISTITRNQFNAAQVALNAAFLPSIMLSGFIFQIDSMPAVIRAVTYIIPARYFVSTLQSLFLAGNIPVVLVVNVLFDRFGGDVYRPDVAENQTSAGLGRRACFIAYGR